jgi:glycosyltransferase involved in cell wall biosynthesis
MTKLAIVIPAYKGAYFTETLDCFVRQTNKDFHIYIGDDCSNDRLEELIQPYRDKLPITYHRFDYNIGSKNIVDQWKRCITLINDEEWIWVFSDDDLVDPNGVDSFWKILSSTGSSHDIYSFNTVVINKAGDIRSNAPDVPHFETSEQMAYYLLLGERANCLPDHIFSRAVYEKYGGFVKTAYGQGSDWANTILFSSEKGSCIIPNSLVYWRFSGENISSNASVHKSEMIIGHFQFIRWILNHFAYLEKNAPANYEKIKEAALKNLLSVIDYHYKGVPLSKVIYFGWFVHHYFNTTLSQTIKYVTTLNAYSMRIANERKQKQ